MAEILWVELLTILVATGAIYLGSDWLEEASAKLAVHYELPPVVQGGIIAAAGSSFPELASVIFAALAGSFGLGVGAIVGSAIFNVLVIPALAVLLSPGNVNSTRTLVHKENLFYMLAVVVLFLIFAMAVIYNPAAPQVGRLTRQLAVVPLVVYCLYLFLQWQDTADYVATAETVKTSPLRQWAALAGGLLVILIAVERLVDAVIIVGDTVGTPDFLWGATIVAAATSLPDAIVSIQAAGKERDVASISNVLGSNTFDLLVVIPIGVLLTGSALIDFSIAAPMMGCLVGATVLLFMALRTDLELSTQEAYVLLAAYVLFVAWVASEALHVTTFLL